MAPVKNVDSNYNCQVQKTFGTSMHKTWTPKFTNCRLVCTITCIKAELYNTCIFQSWACATFPFLRANRQCAHIWLKSPCLRLFHSIGAYVLLRLFLNHNCTSVIHTGINCPKDFFFQLFFHFSLAHSCLGQRWVKLNIFNIQIRNTDNWEFI